MELLRTKNYDMFKFLNLNRPIDQNWVDHLAASMQFNNMLDFHPVHVDANLGIIDGQHRVLAAKKIGVEVVYLMDKKATVDDIPLLNATQKQWKLENFIYFFARKGIPSYIQLEKLKEQTKFGYIVLLKLFGCSGHILRKLKDGTFTFPKSKQPVKVDELMELLQHLRDTLPSNSKFLDSNKFQIALSDFIKNDDIDVEIMKRKASLVPSKFRICGSTQDYKLMLENIYYYRTKRVHVDYNNKEIASEELDQSDFFAMSSFAQSK